ncbi:hypothetical protein GRI58_15050 [Porphyrobacter algicida]|uniref:Uncharacterized protein n=1 Tax=Qipengyuania algicida TaxID=1836209 RepID=A0A845AML5_9SPHN|nr:hypothetical protein [Qipengyuania algicida]MXP30125.1 hypothetical protein [Qipengyuania algicida]
MTDDKLTEAIRKALLELEGQGEIVIVAPNVSLLSEFVAQSVLEVIPSPELSRDDLSKIKGLLVHLTCGPAFYAEDLPAATGATMEEFRAIAERLPLPE